MSDLPPYDDGTSHYQQQPDHAPHYDASTGNFNDANTSNFYNTNNATYWQTSATDQHAIYTVYPEENSPRNDQLPFFGFSYLEHGMCKVPKLQFS